MKKNMRIAALCGLLLVSVAFAVAGCGGDEDAGEKPGKILFKMVNPGADAETAFAVRMLATSNPPLTGETTETILVGTKAVVGDIWVSQGIVKAGQPDDLEWVRLTATTNTELKSFEDYSLSPKEVPAGTYRSIKISLRNIFYYQTELASDRAVKYELLQTMGSSEDPCDENDESWVKDNHFSEDGNHVLNEDGKFEVASSGEKVGGFTVEPGKTAVVSWRWLMYGCKLFLIDKNANLAFDCGVDDIEDECPPELENMFDFVVEYQ